MTGCADGQPSFPLMFKLVCLDRRRVDAEGVVGFIEGEAESDEPEADGVTGMLSVNGVRHGASGGCRCSGVGGNFLWTDHIVSFLVWI